MVDILHQRVGAAIEKTAVPILVLIEFMLNRYLLLLEFWSFQNYKTKLNWAKVWPA